MKKSFTSRGYNYHLLDHIAFGDKYFDKAETMSSEYLLDCLNAGGVLRIREGDDFYFYISPQVTIDHLEEEVLDHLAEDFPEEVVDPKVLQLIEEERYVEANDAVDDNGYATLLTSVIITENLWLLSQRKYNTNLI